MKYKKYYLDELLDEKRKTANATVVLKTKTEMEKFIFLCDQVRDAFFKKIGNGQSEEETLKVQQRAIIGVEKDVAYYKDEIQEYLREHSLQDEWYPSWYSSLVDGIYHRNWGIAGVAEWKQNPKYARSSSAKLKGDKLFFLVDGKMQLMPQTIPKERREQLVKALLLPNPKLRHDNDAPEIDMLDGTRIKIFRDSITKKGHDGIVFRKFFVTNYSFDEQIQYKTYPSDIKLFCTSLIHSMMNIAFVGSVRTSKTTQLTTFLSYVDPMREGLLIETHPEVPLDDILPNSPTMHFVASGEKLKELVPHILRSDYNYVIMAEARDPYSYHIATEVCSYGSRGSMLCSHYSNPITFPYDVACKITDTFGGNTEQKAEEVARAYNYIFKYIQLEEDYSQKRLEGIYEVTYDYKTGAIKIVTICKYDMAKDSWYFNNHIGEDKWLLAKEGDINAFKVFSQQLELLSEKYPMPEDIETEFVPTYSRGHGESEEDAE